MKYLKKTLSFVLSLAMVFTMVIVPRTGVASAEGTESDTTGDNGSTQTTQDVKYFNVNMYNYHTYDTYGDNKNNYTTYTIGKNDDTASKKDPFNYQSRKIAKEQTGDENEAMLFTDGSRNHTELKPWNVWTAYIINSSTTGDKTNYKTATIQKSSEVNDNDVKYRTNKYYPVTGLVEDNLTSNGEIQFTHPEAGIFTLDDSNGTKDVYTNVKMPFKIDEDGYYYFDSSKYDTYFENGTGESGAYLKYTENNTSTTVNQTKVKNNYGTPVNGFFPFNSRKTSNERGVFHFGMNLSTSFYMPSNGLDKKGKPITFSFSGDDDVWVFIDGHLVLDLGGIHDAIAGEINLQDGKVTVYRGDGDGLTNTDQNLAEPYNNKDAAYKYDNEYLTGNEWKKMNANKQMHNLQVFYLERGQTVSNCKIRFNIPQPDTLEVIKSLGNQNATQEDMAAFSDQKFKFTLKKVKSDVEGTKEEYDDADYEVCKNAKYDVFQNNAVVNSSTTDANGQFELKFGQRASFGKVDSGTYKVEEASGNYDTSWQTSKNGVFSNKGTTGSSNGLYLTVDENDGIADTCTYQFTNTIKSTITDDVIVVDYGKKIAADVLANDISLGGTKTISGIKAIDKTDQKDETTDVTIDETDTTDETDVTTDETNGFGTDALILDNGEATIEGNKIMYRPFQYMSSIDKLNYSVLIKNGDDDPGINYDGTNGNGYGTLSIIPATTVYYEDNFGGKNDANEPGLAITYTGDWYTVTDDTTIGQKENSNSADLSNGQKIDPKASGNTNTDVQDDGSVGKGHIYGYDSTYEDDGKFSDGSSAVVNGSYNSSTGKYNATAEFDFTGTGFDIISRTDKNCGTIYVTVTDNKDGKILVKQKNGDYTKSTDPDEKTISVINKGTNDLYQIPVISLTGLPHGYYNVKIEVCGESEILGTGATFYLDAIRIYEPIKSSTTLEDTTGNATGDSNNSEGTGDGNTNIDEGSSEAGGIISGESKEAEEAYSKDNELDAKVDLVKKIILNEDNTEDGKINNYAFIDTLRVTNNDDGTTSSESGSSDDADTYDNLGPNNEVYLSKGQAITFTINAGTEKPVGVYLGAKSPKGNSSKLTVSTVGKEDNIGTREITSATDMYYDITKYVNFTLNNDGYYTATIVVGNKADANDLLSLTNIKYLYKGKIGAKQTVKYSISEDNTEAVSLAKTMLRMAKPVDPEPTEPEKTNLEISSAEFTSSKVSILKSATLVVKTSPDVKYLGILDSDGRVIEPTSTTSEVDEALVGTENDSVAKTWTVKIKFDGLGTKKVAVYGIGENGDASEEVKETSIKVTLLGSIKDLFTEWW